MKTMVLAPANLLTASHLEKALADSGVSKEASELWLPEGANGFSFQWLRQWANQNDLVIREYQDAISALNDLAQSPGSTIVAVISPESPGTLDLVSEAESLGIPVYMYRELYRQDPRLNCRFSPVDRPDTWLRNVTTEQKDFFQRLHNLCQEYGVTINTSGSQDSGSILTFSDGTNFEGVDLERNSCRVRPQGAFRYRKISLD